MTIFVVVQTRDGSAHPISLEAIEAGLELGRQTGLPVEALIPGSRVAAAAATVAATGVVKVHQIEDPALENYSPAGWVAALVPALADARYVVFPHTYQSVDCMARVAHELGADLLSEATGFEKVGDELQFRRPVLGGKLQATVRQRGTGTLVVSVQSASFDGASPSGSPAEIVQVSLAASPTLDREFLGVETVGGDTVDLGAAERIVAVGRGIGGEDKMTVIQELASALGAEIGASRPVIDNGWLPRDRQIGSSGQTVAPKLYVAVGISGAIQHLVGMKGSTCTVAINKDPGAPIFTVADYGIVGDLFDVVPALTAALREAGS